MPDRTRVVIMGAAGRDFHNFNVYFRSRPDYDVVAFTAAQIPGIAGRTYPPVLSGDLYPQGIPILPESDLERIIAGGEVELVVLAYSDLSHERVMHLASRALAAGADFRLMGPRTTMLRSSRPVISVCAVRTGAGKSTVSRSVVRALKRMGKRVAVVRHPMPYGDLARQVVERFATYDDMRRYNCTIEEREEYEPHVEAGNTVFAGVDYERVLRMAEAEAEIIVWDGGNNDLPFYKPDLHIVVADPLRPGDERGYHPGEANVRMADVVVINKVDSAARADVDTVRKNVRFLNPLAKLIEAASEPTVSDESLIRGKRVLVVEDGPTVTHGGMKEGVGALAARRFGALELVDPRDAATGSLRDVYRRFPNLGLVLPAMGYSEEQVRELGETVQKVRCDSVVLGTPIDLAKLVPIEKPTVRVRYEIREVAGPTIEEVLRGLQFAKAGGSRP